MLSSGFIVLNFTIRSVIHFDITFVKGLYPSQSVSGFLFFFFLFSLHVRSPVVPESFVEKTTHPPLSCLCSSFKNQLTTCVYVYFWTLYCISFIISFIYVSVLSPIPCCTDDLGFIKNCIQ